MLPARHWPRSSGSALNRCAAGLSRAQVDAGDKTGPSSDELEEIKRLRAEVRDLKESNEILKQASIFFARELDPRRR